MNELTLLKYWNDIPIGKENAVSYAQLCRNWNMTERGIRMIFNELNAVDTGGEYVLVRSARGKGFYRTNDAATLTEYRRECINKARSVFYPVKKINRVLSESSGGRIHGLRMARELSGYTQKEVCQMSGIEELGIDNVLLSKMENGVCVPTPAQIDRLAAFYKCLPEDITPEYYL